MVTVRMEPDLVTDPNLLGILAELSQREPLFHRREIMSSREDFERETGPGTYLLSYTLRQGDRITRRLTVWQGGAETGWKVLYHQGTVVS